MKCPITYKQIIQYVKEHYGYIVQTNVIIIGSFCNFQRIAKNIDIIIF